MGPTLTNFPRNPCLARARWIALTALLTLGSALLLAHEGHAPLPMRGVQVDVPKGHLVLMADAREAIGLETGLVEMHPIEERILAYATIVAPWHNHAFATSRLTGRIVRVSVTPGQSVQAGQTVAEVESVELDTLQLDLLAARNEIALSEKLVKELTRSAEAGAVAGQAVLDAQSRLAQNRNSLELARSKWLGLGLPAGRLDELLDAGQPLADLTLPVTAPVSGTIIHAELNIGKVIEPREHLAEIIDFSSVWVRIEVLEKDLHRVKAGTRVELEFAAHPGQTFRTSVTAGSYYLEPSTGVSVVWAELTNPREAEIRFRPGMSARASLIVSDNPFPSPIVAAVVGSVGVSMTTADRSRSRATVPARAVLREGVERFLLVEEASIAGSSEYRMVPVVTGRESEGRVEIVSGRVYPGDRVVTRGAHELGPFFAPTILRPSPEAHQAIKLKVEAAHMSSIDEVLSLEGMVEIPPAHRGFAASQLAGTVQSILVGLGEHVESGQVLATVYSPELLDMQQELLRLHLEHSLVSDTLSRLRKAGVGIAGREVWELESKLISLRAQSSVLRRKLATAGLEAARIEELLVDHRPVMEVPIRAPLSGRIVNFEKTLGQAVAAHEALFEVHGIIVPAIRGLVSERDAGRIRVGHRSRVRFMTDTAFVGTGRVARSSGMVGTESRTQAIWVELDSHPARPLLHGQLVELSIVLGRRPPALTVPRTALVVEGTSSFLFVRNTDGTFERRAVEVGPANDRFVTVTGNLAEGEPVAVSGVPELMTGYSSLR